jgi:hypothetical protein
LWRSELDALANQHGVPTKSRDLIKEVRRQLSDALPMDVIRSHVLVSLKQRYRYSKSSASRSLKPSVSTMDWIMAQIC